MFKTEDMPALHTYIYSLSFPLRDSSVIKTLQSLSTAIPMAPTEMKKTTWHILGEFVNWRLRSHILSLSLFFKWLDRTLRTGMEIGNDTLSMPFLCINPGNKGFWGLKNIPLQPPQGEYLKCQEVFPPFYFLRKTPFFIDNFRTYNCENSKHRLKD